jgi:hypothetical protein
MSPTRRFFVTASSCSLLAAIDTWTISTKSLPRASTKKALGFRSPV